MFRKCGNDPLDCPSPSLRLALNFMGRCRRGGCRIPGSTPADGHVFQRFGEVTAKVCVALERHGPPQAKAVS